MIFEKKRKKKLIDKITTAKNHKINRKNVNNRDMTKLIDKMLSERDKPNWQNDNRDIAKLIDKC